MWYALMMVSTIFGVISPHLLIFFIFSDDIVAAVAVHFCIAWLPAQLL